MQDNHPIRAIVSARAGDLAAMPTQTTTLTGTVARIEWERFHHTTSAILLLTDGRILHVHSQGLGEDGQDHLLLTRDGDLIEATLAQEPEPHVCKYSNRSIAAMNPRAQTARIC